LHIWFNVVSGINDIGPMYIHFTLWSLRKWLW